MNLEKKSKKVSSLLLRSQSKEFNFADLELRRKNRSKLTGAIFLELNAKLPRAKCTKSSQSNECGAHGRLFKNERSNQECNTREKKHSSQHD